jgi:hypothetical protein
MLVHMYEVQSSEIVLPVPSPITGHGGHDKYGTYQQRRLLCTVFPNNTVIKPLSPYVHKTKFSTSVVEHTER